MASDSSTPAEAPQSTAEGGRSGRPKLGGGTAWLAEWPSWKRWGLAGGAVALVAGAVVGVTVLAHGGPFRVVTIDPAMAGDVKGLGDIDGDGFADLVIGGKAGSEDMAWYQYPSWQKHPLQRATKEFTTDMQLADVDGDGDLDVVVPDGDGANNVVWLENPRPARPAATKDWKRHVIGSHGGWVHDVGVADLDGDGDLDVVTRKGTTVLWFQGPRGRWSKRDLSPQAGPGEGLGVGDVDGDGDPDLVTRCRWLENPKARGGKWRTHPLCEPWSDDMSAAVADLDGDGRMEILTTSQHESEKLSLFSRRGPKAEWQETVVDPHAGSHKIGVADFNLDGRLDIQTALEEKNVVLYLASGQGQFTKMPLPYDGHNVRVGDVGTDGDIDLFGSGYTGHPPLHLWENLLADDPPTEGTLPPGAWTRKIVARKHQRTFGLAFGDVDGDGDTDIVSGVFWYENDGGPERDWSQHPFVEGTHAILVTDVDGDDDLDVIAQKDDGTALGVYWAEAGLHGGTVEWTTKRVGELPRASHDLGTQGYTTADLIPGGRDEVLMTTVGGAYYFEIPKEPARTPWKRHHINADASDEGVAAADFDGDGRLDVVTTTGESKRVEVHLNPADPKARWRTHVIGRLPDAVYLDRIAAADFNGDGKVDVVVTEENREDSGARNYWLEQPARRFAGEWPKHLFATQASANAMDVGDLDGDGDVDIVLGEHKGALKVSAWMNDGKGHFSLRILSAGIESHLGARLVDLDGDGDLDVVSIAWDRPEILFALYNERQ